jgi:hypothetical protein
MKPWFDRKQFFYQPNSDVLLLQPFSRLAVYQLAFGNHRTATMHLPVKVVLVLPELCKLQTANCKFLL